MQLFTKLILTVGVCLSSTAIAGTPLWTFTPLTSTTLEVPENATAIVQYLVTNQSSKTHTLQFKPVTGITQVTSGYGVCGNPFPLQGKASCTLTLQIDGSHLTNSINDGPLVCQQGSINQCYRPSQVNILRITKAAPVLTATIAESGSPLSIARNGATGFLTISNNSTTVTATNIASDFSGTALDGNVTESGNTCASVPPLSSCTLTYVSGSNIVAATDFTIQGTNTNSITASLQIISDVNVSGISPSSGPAAGGTGVTISGAALTGTSSITFDNIAATSIHVVNSTTVTAVTPAHAAGAVDVVVTTPSGSATLINGFTYNTSAVGQSTGGGVIACLGGGQRNLIASIADNSSNVTWGDDQLGTTANDTLDGSTNTDSILSQDSTRPIAASICESFEVDSQGNTPCEIGNTCYNDWFLPAGGFDGSDQLSCLYDNRIAIGGFLAAEYWSSTEASTPHAYFQNFADGSIASDNKTQLKKVRCVRLLQ